VAGGGGVGEQLPFLFLDPATRFRLTIGYLIELDA
jgi:hypothetical protein